MNRTDRQRGRTYLVGPFVGLEELTVEWGLVLHWVQAEQSTVV